jgi:arylsulfatase A-like enzyme
MYTDDLDPTFTCWPPYQEGIVGRNEEYFAQLSERELNFIRAQYAGKVTMVDKWLGRVFEKLDEHKLWDDTMVIVTSDHGHELGEKGRFGKPYPHYDLNARIPLLVWHPALRSNGSCGVHDSGFTQPMDINATIADAMGADVAATSPHGRSFLPRLENHEWSGRDCVLYGTHGAGAVLTTDKYTYASRIMPDLPLYRYSSYLSKATTQAEAGCFLHGVDSLVWKEPVNASASHPEVLFDRPRDPDQNENIAAAQPEATRQMRDRLKHKMEVLYAPEEQYARLGLA